MRRQPTKGHTNDSSKATANGVTRKKRERLYSDHTKFSRITYHRLLSLVVKERSSSRLVSCVAKSDPKSAAERSLVASEA